VVFLYTIIEEKVILCFITLGDILFQDPMVSSIFSKLCYTWLPFTGYCRTSNYKIWQV